MKLQEEQRYQEIFKPSSEVQILIDKAQEAVRDNKDALALSLWSQALSKSENLPLVLLQRGSSYLAEGQSRKGYDDLYKLEALLRQHGFQEKADVIAQMIKDVKAESDADNNEDNE